MLMETHTARERLRSAGEAKLHWDRNYHRGQWVYVWRRDLRGARDRTVGPALSRWVGPGLAALQDGTTVWVSMRGRLWKCAPEQNREATCHESSGAELLTHDHLRQLLMDARSPQTLTEAVDVSAEWAQEENQNPSHRSEAHPTDEVETRNQSPTPMPLSPRNDGQRGSQPELVRMDQIVAAESNRLDVSAPRTQRSDKLDRTPRRDHDQHRGVPKYDVFVSEAISSWMTTHPLSDLDDDAASTRRLFKPFH